MNRHVPLTGQPNFRDLGGYAAGDGRRIKWGAVYRSGELSQLTDDDVGKLGQLGIRTVVDFRSPEEVSARGEGRLVLSGVVPLFGERRVALSRDTEGT